MLHDNALHADAVIEGADQRKRIGGAGWLSASLQKRGGIASTPVPEKASFSTLHTALRRAV